MQLLWEAPDIIGFQEVIHHQLTDLASLLPEYGFVGVGRDDGKDAGEVRLQLAHPRSLRLMYICSFRLFRFSTTSQTASHCLPLLLTRRCPPPCRQRIDLLDTSHFWLSECV